MAVFLMRKHELLVLEVSLRVAGRETFARLELVSNEGGSSTPVGSPWKLSAEEMGLPLQLPPTGMPGFRLPADLLAGLRERLEDLGIQREQPLWLLLVKPYGYLGLVPWEALLVPELGRPMLRLPDFLEPPRENREVLDVALCCSAPVSEPAIHPPRLVEEVAREILSSSPRPRTTIHVFADADFHDELRSSFAGEPRVAVHDPGGAARYAEPERRGGPSGGCAITSPWLLWVRDAMEGRSLDALHFVCHGYLADDRPALSLAESPLSNRDRIHARYVGVAELAAFLTQTGAWAAAFTDPLENYSEAGLRLLADTLAQTRPGPVLFHSLRSGTTSSLSHAYEFLFSLRPGRPPLDPAIFAYCQPALVEGQAPMKKPASPAAMDFNAALIGAASSFVEVTIEKSPTDPDPMKPLEVVPSWVAAAQRHVEEVSLNLQRRKGSSSSERSRSTGRTEAAEKTLNELQQIVAQYARTMGNTD